MENVESVRLRIDTAGMALGALSFAVVGRRADAIGARRETFGGTADG